MKLVYLDNAATSFPKPPQVTEGMVYFMDHVGANPGRSGHPLAQEAGRIVQAARDGLARLFNIDNPSRISFAMNVTEALNTVFNGYLNPGDHVVTTAMEHNSVMRPLVYLQEKGDITLDIASCDRKGFLDVDALKRLLQKNTRLMVLNHASNVCGTLQDVAAVRRAIGDIPLLLDTAQTAGAYPIDVKALGIDFLAFTGHKGLMGPQGTGGLYVREGIDLRPLKRGGTGSQSENLHQPDFMPDALEAGTQNNVGIAGLGAAVAFILKEGVDKIRRHEQALTKALLDGIYNIQNITIYGPLNPAQQVATVSITFDSTLSEDARGSLGCGAINLEWFNDGVPIGEAEGRLSGQYNILVRVGLHCAPVAHKTIGTFPDGTVRLSMGYFNTLEDIDLAIEAIRRIANAQYP
ncbi:MAG: putative cysteine desulfurase [Syntrophorhabdus sp. PtaU1.Bin058]|nr:MAG: putative cysteine desulfurase [Syntrophorhabdus sp. PtaU1.Bin058]